MTIDNKSQPNAEARERKYISEHLWYFQDDPDMNVLAQEGDKSAIFTKNEELKKLGLTEGEMKTVWGLRDIIRNAKGAQTDELRQKFFRDYVEAIEIEELEFQTSKKKPQEEPKKEENQQKDQNNGNDLQVKHSDEQHPTLISKGFLPDVDWAVETMKRFQELKKRLLDNNDTMKKGDREYPKKSGCRKYALAFRLSLQTTRIEREEVNGEKVARVWTRAIAPDGTYVDGYGVCDSETVKKSKMDPTWHNIESKAQTRSYNRGILDLVGGGEVSAEEIE